MEGEAYREAAATADCHGQRAMLPLTKTTCEPCVKQAQLVCEHGALRPSDDRAGVAAIHNGCRKRPRELAASLAAFSRIVNEQCVPLVVHLVLIHIFGDETTPSAEPNRRGFAFRVTLVVNTKEVRLENL